MIELPLSEEELLQQLFEADQEDCEDCEEDDEC